MIVIPHIGLLGKHIDCGRNRKNANLPNAECGMRNKGDAESQKERKGSVKSKVKSVKLYTSARFFCADAQL